MVLFNHFIIDAEGFSIEMIKGFIFSVVFVLRLCFILDWLEGSNLTGVVKLCLAFSLFSLVFGFEFVI